MNRIGQMTEPFKPAIETYNVDIDSFMCIPEPFPFSVFDKAVIWRYYWEMTTKGYRVMLITKSLEIVFFKKVS